MYANKKKNNFSKVVVLMLCLSLLVGGVIGGTIAYLMDTTDEVKNTFTAGDVDIEFAETKPEGNTAIMVPGHYIEKDPKVTVLANSEDCYVFVKIDESANFDKFMTYGIAEGWQPLEDADNDGFADNGVYYREVDKSTSDQPFAILADNKVTVNAVVTKADMDDLTDATNPTLTFTTYAIQKFQTNTGEFGADAAWTELNKSDSENP